MGKRKLEEDSESIEWKEVESVIKNKILKVFRMDDELIGYLHDLLLIEKYVKKYCSVSSIVK